jgi:hypothetical protein
VRCILETHSTVYNTETCDSLTTALRASWILCKLQYITPIIIHSRYMASCNVGTDAVKHVTENMNCRDSRGTTSLIKRSVKSVRHCKRHTVSSTNRSFSYGVAYSHAALVENGVLLTSTSAAHCIRAIFGTSHVIRTI